MKVGGPWKRVSPAPPVESATNAAADAHPIDTAVTGETGASPGEPTADGTPSRQGEATVHTPAAPTEWWQQPEMFKEERTRTAEVRADGGNEGGDAGHESVGPTEEDLQREAAEKERLKMEAEAEKVRDCSFRVPALFRPYVHTRT